MCHTDLLENSSRQKKHHVEYSKKNLRREHWILQWERCVLSRTWTCRTQERPQQTAEARGNRAKELPAENLFHPQARTPGTPRLLRPRAHPLFPSPTVPHATCQSQRDLRTLSFNSVQLCRRFSPSVCTDDADSDQKSFFLQWALVNAETPPKLIKFREQKGRGSRKNVGQRTGREGGHCDMLSSSPDVCVLTNP